MHSKPAQLVLDLAELIGVTRVLATLEVNYQRA
jgi:hypothetical protein